jgi:hypothetical protein
MWFEQCHEDEVCDYYDPVELNDHDEADVADYETELEVRFKTYQRQIAEYNN